MASNQCEQEHKQECVIDEKAMNILELQKKVVINNGPFVRKLCGKKLMKMVNFLVYLIIVVFCFECISKWRKEGNALELKEN
jgi:hypothetical protein